MAPKARPTQKGPARKPGSKVKIACAWKRCRSKKDCKNTGAKCVLARSKVNETMCRTLRPECKMVRFCSVLHKERCRGNEQKGRRGPRESLDELQVQCLFRVLCSAKKPWAAAMTLLQVCLGERATCVCAAQVQWFKGLNTQHPTTTIEKVNRKTVPNLVRGNAAI